MQEGLGKEGKYDGAAADVGTWNDSLGTWLGGGLMHAKTDR